jgi:hypothetical protein
VPRLPWLGGDNEDGIAQREGSSSFLKKRTKKLFDFGLVLIASVAPSRKSFLLLFFKKEGLPSLP